jgi:hypothetical protein
MDLGAYNIQIHCAALAGNGRGEQPRNGGQPAHLDPQDVGQLMGQHDAPFAHHSQQGNQIGRRAADHEQPRLLAQHGRRHLFQALRRRVAPEAVVIHLGPRHGLPHGLGRLGYRVAPQVDQGHAVLSLHGRPDAGTFGNEHTPLEAAIKSASRPIAVDEDILGGIPPAVVRGQEQHHARHRPVAALFFRHQPVYKLSLAIGTEILVRENIAVKRSPKKTGPAPPAGSAGPFAS